MDVPMLSRFKLRRQIRNRNREIVDALYEGVVARSRRPELFAGFGVPDTVMGRFESLGVHVFLALARCGRDESLKPLAQELVDRFIVDIEDSIREIGIGDVAVPKRMRKLTGMFYERVAAYDPPLQGGDAAALAAKLERYALGEAPPDRRGAAGLAAYMLATRAELDGVPAAAILAGRLFGEGRDG
jgi:cytochrome b pre-mRNA-processing protein 3